MIDQRQVEIFLTETLAALKSAAPAHMQRWEPLRLSKQDGRITGWTYGTRPDLSMFVAQVLFRQNYEDISDQIRDHTAFGKLQPEHIRRTKTQSLSLSPSGQVSDLFHQYISRLSNLDGDQELASKMSAAFVQSLEQGATDAVYYGVLRGVFGDADNIQLTSNLRVRKMSELDAERFLSERQSRYTMLPELDGVPNNLHIVEFTTATPHEITEFPILVHDAIFSCLTALRLLKDPPVEIENIYVRPAHLGAVRLILRSHSPRHRRGIFSGKYELTSTDADQLKNVFESLTPIRNTRRIRTAVDRFNFAAERTRVEDQLVDSAITLEAIYGDGGGAATYKIGMRCAAHLGETFEERRAIRKSVESIYRERSSLVHGGGGKEQQLADLAATATHLSRRALKKLGAIAKQAGAMPVAEDFDDILFSEGES